MIKKILLATVVLFLGFAFARTQGCFDDDLSYVAINHGNHKHYLAKERDEGIGLGECPTRPPAADEILSSQCQLIKLITQDGVTYYVPDGADPQMLLTSFPTRPPGPGEQITPQGQVVQVAAH